MTAATLLAQLNSLGLSVALAPDGQHLDVGPADRLTGDLISALRGHKPELIALLSDQDRLANSVPRSSASSADRFADWVQRPDRQGRLGWERPGLSESSRWWARTTFDDLPDPHQLFDFVSLAKATKN